MERRGTKAGVLYACKLAAGTGGAHGVKIQLRLTKETKASVGRMGRAFDEAWNTAISKHGRFYKEVNTIKPCRRLAGLGRVVRVSYQTPQTAGRLRQGGEGVYQTLCQTLTSLHSGCSNWLLIV